MVCNISETVILSEMLACYRPNETFLLTDDQLRQLEGAGRTNATQGDAFGQVLRAFRIDLVHGSAGLAGVPVSWLDTRHYIRLGEAPGSLAPFQMRVISNHKDTVSYLIKNRRELTLGVRTLLQLHTRLASGLSENPLAADEAVLCDFCDKANTIENPFEQAFFAMAFLPCVRPFAEENESTSRIAMNIPLLRHKLTPFPFSDIRKLDYAIGLKSLRERGDCGILSAAFVGAYRKSAAHYVELAQHIEEGGVLATC